MKKHIFCDWYSGQGQEMAYCGMETCDHCGSTGKIKIQKSAMVEYCDFDGDVANGLKIMIPIHVKITCGMNMFNQDSFGDRPLLVIDEVLIQ